MLGAIVLCFIHGLIPGVVLQFQAVVMCDFGIGPIQIGWPVEVLPTIYNIVDHLITDFPTAELVSH